jgi:hypothetical protein
VLLALTRELEARRLARTNVVQLLHYVEGLAAMASGDARTAAARFGECMAEHLECKYREVLALEQSGDRTRAATARQRILDTPMRSPEYLYVRAKLMSGTQPKRP